jgi:hypothetical protein
MHLEHVKLLVAALVGIDRLADGRQIVLIFFFIAHQPLVGQDLFIIKAGRLNSVNTHHTRWDSSGRVISPTQIHLPHTIQDTIDRHPCTWCDSNSQSKQARCRRSRFTPHGNWVRRLEDIYILILSLVVFNGTGHNCQVTDKEL